MEVQRLRNLTTGKLHTQIECVYQDLKFITGMSEINTHQLINVIRAAEPWLKEHVKDQAFWDGEHRTDQSGDYPLEPMTDRERELFMERYKSMENPFRHLYVNVL